MKIRTLTILLAAAIAIASSLVPAAAHSAENVIAIPAADVKWTPGPVPGVSIAPVEGDMAKGASHFYLKYDAGFIAPPHFHSPDHYATIVSGALVMVAGGKEMTFGPGSFFALTGKAVHAARVEGKEACVMFIDARGPWDAVMVEGKK